MFVFKLNIFFRLRYRRKYDSTVYQVLFVYNINLGELLRKTFRLNFNDLSYEQNFFRVSAVIV